MATQRLPMFQQRFIMLRGELTQGEFAEKLGISRPTVSLYESGARIPDAEILRNIAKKCGVSSDWLLGLTDVKSADMDIRAASELTGLREETIEALRGTKWYSNDGGRCIQVTDVVDYLMADIGFGDEIMGDLQDALSSLSPPDESAEVKKAIKFARDHGRVLLTGFEAKDMFLSSAVGGIRVILDEMLGEMYEQSKQKENLQNRSEVSAHE